MFSHALVATDLGPSSETIVACASELGVLGVRDVVLVHAIDIDHTPSSADDTTYARQIQSLERAGIRVHVETALGYAPHAINALAEQHGVDLIVMGTRGKGLFPTGFSGSISSDVVRLSSVPVLLMPADDHAGTRTGTWACSRILSSVLAPVDVAESAEKLCALVFGLAPRGIGKLEMLNVTPFTFETAREGRELEAREQLEALAERAREARGAERDDNGAARRADRSRARARHLRRLLAGGARTAVPGCRRPEVRLRRERGAAGIPDTTPARAGRVSA